MIEERAILAALERIARMQDSIRSGMDICRDTGLVFLRVYYEQLPPNVARRLTELHAEDMAEIPRATSTEDRSFLYHSSASFRRCRARIALSPSMTFSHCAMFSHSMRSTWATRLTKP